ncbi:putative holin [Desulfovibrio sp. OttesenSCG-928-M16]|nr:putative holin [Desulfovibrio sp. OttesenSCG-928-M16]
MFKVIAFISNPRLWFVLCGLALAALLTLLALLAPQQVPVAAYKLCLLLLAGLAGYCLDRSLFPYAEPSGYLLKDWRKEPHADVPFGADYPVVAKYKLLFAAAMLRQTAIICMAMLAVGLGL